jgi:adenylosuccinate lyase
MAMFGEEFLIALESLHNLLGRYPARGLKGAVGTQVDQIQLFDGDRDKVRQVEEEVLEYLGLPRLLDNVGQVYPRTLDFQVVGVLYALAGGPSSLAKTLRLMAGHELASEGFAPGQVGSSAMPHKMNSRSCERINGFQTILRGHVAMSAGLSGDQWNEGDVSCSVVRRVVIPDAFFAVDGLLETVFTVLRQMEIHPAMIELENCRNFPFLLTTTVLMEAVKAGVGRETAHAVIKKHSLEVVQALRQGEILANNLMERLAGDDQLGLSRETLERLLSHAAEQVGAADRQVDQFLARVVAWEDRVPEAKAFQPTEIL